MQEKKYLLEIVILYTLFHRDFRTGILLKYKVNPKKIKYWTEMSLNRHIHIVTFALGQDLFSCMCNNNLHNGTVK